MLPDADKYMPIVKQYMTSLSEKGAESRQKKTIAKARVTGKTKIMNNIGSVIPQAGVVLDILKGLGLSQNEAFAVLTDESFVKGIMVMVQTFGGSIQKLSEFLGKKTSSKSSKTPWA